MNLQSIIIVLTPIKNEAWILHQFLSVTNLFADCIIVADQRSTDESRNICKQFSKVHLIENNEPEYDEASRQLLLINTARLLFPDKKRILFALDADEIFSSDSMYFTDSWKKIKDVLPGTTIYFEKPDILPGVEKCVRYRDNYFPIGYIDDGINHNAKFIHSTRVPVNSSGKTLFINDIKILHFALTRKNGQSSKLRYYSVIENIKKTTPTYLRRKLYKCFFDEQDYYSRNVENINEAWLKEWKNKNIDFTNLDDPEFSWQDFEVLSFFKKFGYKKFYFENIWEFNWEACRQKAIELGKEAPSGKVKNPGLMIYQYSKMLDTGYRFYKWLKPD